MTRTLGVITPQTLNGVTYQFSSWSDAGAATHNISTPATDTTYTAVANADLTNYVTGTNVGTVAVVNSNATASTVYQVGYRGSKRYVKGNLNF